jgi:hypothetical protein
VAEKVLAVLSPEKMVESFLQLRLYAVTVCALLPVFRQITLSPTLTATLAGRNWLSVALTTCLACAVPANDSTKPEARASARNGRRAEERIRMNDSLHVGVRTPAGRLSREPFEPTGSPEIS